MPARAAWALTAFARLPVEAQAMVVKPNSRAWCGDGDDAVLEGPGGVGAVVLEVEVVEAEVLAQVLGPDQRREAGLQVHGSPSTGRRSRVAPERLRAARDASREIAFLMPS